MTGSKKKIKNKAILKSALDDWRFAERADAAAAQVSAPVRERILDSIQGGGETRVTYQSPLFLPLRRIALVAAVPVMVLALAVGYLLSPTAGPVGDMATDATSLDVIRQGEEIVFVIANGQSTHLVYKSTEINGLRGATPTKVSNGVYRDRIDRQADLVFYRID